MEENVTRELQEEMKKVAANVATTFEGQLRTEHSDLENTVKDRKRF